METLEGFNVEVRLGAQMYARKSESVCRRKLDWLVV